MQKQLISEDAKGVYVIAATPFADDGSLDFTSADAMIDFYLAAGADGLTILGVMGEAHKLTPEEARGFTKRVLKRVAGRMPVIVGVSAPGILPLQELARFAMDAGAAGVMLAPVRGLEGDEAVERYLSLALSSLGSDIPVCLQDFPPVNGVHIPVRSVHSLTDRHENLVMFKHEDHPGLNKLSRIRDEAAKAGTRRLSILVGNSGLFLPHELDRGADGAMTGFAFPEVLVGICRHMSAGDRTAAYDLFDDYLPLVRYEQQPGLGLAIRKEMLRRRGVIKSAAVRSPGPSLSARDGEDMDFLLSRLSDRARSVLVHTRGIG
ncbi:MAG: dihydrodipicolinate synthase family protein [Parvibaculaceae bacterium]